MSAFKLGRTRPALTRRLHFAAYAGPELPDPPDFVHRGKKALLCLSAMYRNDVLSNCTSAGAAHGEGVWTGNAGNNDPFATDAEATQFYSETVGFVEGDPSTDNGGDEVTVLNFWRDTGYMIGGKRHKIETWCNVDATNPKQVRQALWLGEFLYFGIELPTKWITPMPSGPGFVWDVAGDPIPANGHCYISASYDANSRGVIIDPWGGCFGLMTMDAIAKYASGPGGELHVAFSEDCINRATQKTDSGFDFQALVADSLAFAA